MRFLVKIFILSAFIQFVYADQTSVNGEYQIVLKNGVKISFYEIKTMSGEKKDEIVDDMSEEQYSLYSKYRDAEIEQKKSENEKMEASIKQQKAENEKMKASIKQKDALLNKGYTLYLSNIENGSPGERKILNKIISDDDRPQELKNRARAILNNEKKYKLK